MNENCKNCAWLQSLRGDVSRLEEDVKNINERLGEVEKFSASGGEQIKMIFKILNEIKDSIKDIAFKIEEIEEQPVKEYSQIKLSVITAICSGGIGTLLGFIFSK